VKKHNYFVFTFIGTEETNFVTMSFSWVPFYKNEWSKAWAPKLYFSHLPVNCGRVHQISCEIYLV